jgi:hypothetical protein
MPAPPPRALRTLTTVFGACAILALGAVLLRLVGASRQGWALQSLDLILLAIDGLVVAINATAWYFLRRAWLKAAA